MHKGNISCHLKDSRPTTSTFGDQVVGWVIWAQQGHIEQERRTDGQSNLWRYFAPKKSPEGPGQDNLSAEHWEQQERGGANPGDAEGWVDLVPVQEEVKAVVRVEELE